MDPYTACLAEALRRKKRGELTLCPRGYCSAKQKFASFPSAYANGYASRVCSGHAADAAGRRGGGGRGERGLRGAALERWFEEEWVDVCSRKKGGPGGYSPCGHKKGDGEGRGYCRPLKRVSPSTPRTVSELGRGEAGSICRARRVSS